MCKQETLKPSPWKHRHLSSAVAATDGYNSEQVRGRHTLVLPPSRETTVEREREGEKCEGRAAGRYSHLTRLRTRILFGQKKKKQVSEATEATVKGNKLGEKLCSRGGRLPGREGAERPLLRARSMRGHKGGEPVGKLGMSGGQIEVLIRGRALQPSPTKSEGEEDCGGIIFRSFITEAQSDRISPLITPDLARSCV